MQGKTESKTTNKNTSKPAQQVLRQTGINKCAMRQALKATSGEACQQQSIRHLTSAWLTIKSQTTLTQSIASAMQCCQWQSCC